MNKKRVILLHHVSDQGGGTRSLIDMAVMLKETFDVTVCLPCGSTKTMELAAGYGISCHEIKNPIPTLDVFSGGPGLSKNFIKDALKFRRVRAVADELLKLEPDVIILNSIVMAPIARYIPKNIKTICFIRETIVHSIFDSRLKDTFENYIDGVAYIADHERRVLNVKNPVQAVIPDSLEPTSMVMYSRDEAREKLDLDKDVFYILYMGGSAKIKGFDTMLEAMSYLDDSYCVLIVGDLNLCMYSRKNALLHFYNINHFNYLNKTRKLLAGLKSDKRVNLMGYQNDISALMCAADVIVFPSKYAHQPRPCIEAGMYGKPVILSDFEATEEFFKDKYNALTFIPDSGKDLADKIRMLRENENLHMTIGENNYQMSIREHDFYKIQNDFLEFVKSVAFK